MPAAVEILSGRKSAANPSPKAAKGYLKLTGGLQGIWEYIV